MDNDIKQIIDKYKFNKELRKYTNKHYFKSKNRIYREIKTIEDIERAKNEIEYNLKLYSKTYPLTDEDIETIEKSLAKYEIAICKVIQCYNYNALYSDFYNAEQLKRLIDNRFKYEEKLNEIKMRKMCQD